MNESDALGKQYPRIIADCRCQGDYLGYLPRLKGAGYALGDRKNFISSVDMDNKAYRWNEVEENKNKWFRPSDVAIGTDGAIYVADWYDPIVGGHEMLDKKGYRPYYRIAPNDKKLTSPAIDLSNTKGQRFKLC